MNLYSRTLLKIPTPKYFVLYNGDDDTPDRTELKLSDSFIRKVEAGSFEWTATMLAFRKEGWREGLKQGQKEGWMKGRNEGRKEMIRSIK